MNAPRWLWLLLIALPAQGLAQAAESPHWLVTTSRYGKWVTLAGAAGLTAVALDRNREADRVFDALSRFCAGAPDECRLTAVGTTTRYQGDDAERLYQETLRLDRNARTWLLGGQVTLLASGVLFLVDLISGDDGPRNIPYTGLEAYWEPATVGLRRRF